MVRPFKFIAAENDEGLTLISFLSGKLQISRKKAKALINTRMVFVNGKRTWMANHSISRKNVIEFQGDPVANRKIKPSKLNILYRDDDYIVVDKPAGMTSNQAGSVEDALNSMKDTGSCVAVHRLDRDTTGCLLFALHDTALDEAVKLFRNKEVKKTYHAIVLGKPERETMTIKSPIEGKRAVTHFKTFDMNRAAAHLQISIQTGRTHQIRKHLASRGLPVAGDRYYGPQGKKNPAAQKAGRQMLHASGLEFINPVSGKLVRVKAPLPKDFRRCLKMLNLS